MSWLASVNFNAMNYPKVIEELEHHASEAAEFLASYPDPDEMESEKAAHRAMVCAVHALRELTQERAAHLEAMQYTVSVDKILRPGERHTRLEGEREMLIGFREAVRRIAAKPIDSSDMMDEIEHLLSLPQNIRRSDTP